MLRKIYHLLPKSYSDAIPKYTSRLNLSISQSINQSVKIYIAPSQDTYSEELPTQVKRKTTVLRRWWNWEQAPFGGRLRSTGSPFQVFRPTTENERVCIVAERANVTTKIPRAEDRSVNLNCLPKSNKLNQCFSQNRNQHKDQLNNEME